MIMKQCAIVDMITWLHLC